MAPVPVTLSNHEDYYFSCLKPFWMSYLGKYGKY